ncbi:lasso peptide biosynthesis B2 protein [Celerinatantimonas sp. YJH-8]|uniref:lasso peptide biosynthesis B2 protein n=1 Tax=Celerinatantimonas sp. YJH-8 TaxID=3228714 RepID=UPI0038BEDC5E
MINFVIRFLRQPLFIQLWAIPVWLLLGLSKLCIFQVSFKQLAIRLGDYQADQFWVPLITRKQIQRARLIGRLVQGVAPYTLWDSNCFPQAVTAQLLLRLYRIPSALYLGLAKTQHDPKLKAHAWLCSGQVRVTGGFSFNQFTPVAQFITRIEPQA